MRIPVALLVLVCFGCATVRVPAGSVEGLPPDLGEVADPKVELWLEGGSAASPSETAEAQKAARDALAIAIARRRPDVSALGARIPSSSSASPPSCEPPPAAGSRSRPKGEWLGASAPV